MLTERIGALLDSTMDRHSDMLLDMGLPPEKAGP